MRIGSCVIAVLLAATSVLAHHRTVTEWKWTNPHVWIFLPHSDQFTVRERIKFTSPGILEDRITVDDPKALIEPLTSVRRYRKVSAPNDELREFSCAEGLAIVK